MFHPIITVIGRKVRDDMKKKKRTRFFKSLQYALEGIFTGIKQERNMKIHCIVVLVMVFFGIFLHITVTEWCICLILFGLILALELVNTAVEAVVDLVTEEYKPLAKEAKDMAAGAVLTGTIIALIVGSILFLPKIYFLFV